MYNIGVEIALWELQGPLYTAAADGLKFKRTAQHFSRRIVRAYQRREDGGCDLIEMFVYFHGAPWSVWGTRGSAR